MLWGADTKAAVNSWSLCGSIQASSLLLDAMLHSPIVLRSNTTRDGDELTGLKHAPVRLAPAVAAGSAEHGRSSAIRAVNAVRVVQPRCDREKRSPVGRA
jgi:hypothetical protein